MGPYSMKFSVLCNLSYAKFLILPNEKLFLFKYPQMS